MQDRLKVLHNPYSRAALGGLAALILTGATLSLVRPDRRIAWVQGFAAVFYLLVTVLLARSKGILPAIAATRRLSLSIPHLFFCSLPWLTCPL